MQAKTKDLLFLSPEIYLLLATIFYWTQTSTLFNPVAIVLISVLVYQMVFKKLTTGLIIASLFILLNLYMVLALFSELSEFPEHNAQWQQLLVFGLLFLGGNLFVGVIMFTKYIRRHIK